MFIWNPQEHSDQENLQWAWLRAVEWCHWPLFLSLPIAPPLLAIYGPLPVGAVLLLLEIAWSAVRYRWISAECAGIAASAATLRWISGPATAIWLFVHHRYVLAPLALFWPFVVPLLGAFTSSQIGRVQMDLMRQLGYLPTPSHPLFKATVPRTSPTDRKGVLRKMVRGARDGTAISLVVVAAAWALGLAAEHSVEGGRHAAAAASLALFIVGSSAFLGTLAFWIASRPRRIWRAIGGFVVFLLILNAVLSLIDLALIGDALPGGMPTPLGIDPTHLKALSEYGLGLFALVYGWFSGARRRRRSLSTVTRLAT